MIWKLWRWNNHYLSICTRKDIQWVQDTRCEDEIYLLQWSFLSLLVLSQWVYLCRYLDNKTRSVWKPHGALLNGCWRQRARKNCAISPFRPRRNLFAQLSSGIGSARGDGTGERMRERGRAREKEKREKKTRVEWRWFVL